MMTIPQPSHHSSPELRVPEKIFNNWEWAHSPIRNINAIHGSNIFISNRRYQFFFFSSNIRVSKKYQYIQNSTNQFHINFKHFHIRLNQIQSIFSLLWLSNIKCPVRWDFSNGWLASNCSWWTEPNTTSTSNL